jgi:hypothetical protein
MALSLLRKQAEEEEMPLQKHWPLQERVQLNIAIGVEKYTGLPTSGARFSLRSEEMKKESSRSRIECWTMQERVHLGVVIG